jgi:hypothetical protein
MLNYVLFIYACIFFSILLLYIFKYTILNFLLNIYSYYKITMRKKDGFYKKTEMLLQHTNETYLYLEEHYIVENGNEQNVVFISDKKKDIIKDIDIFRKNLDNFIKKKNIILYCGIKDNGIIEIEDDLTNDFRSFLYYYDKNNFKLDIFFSYLNVNLDSKFIIYKNDNNLTEKNFIVKDIVDKTFSDILS